MKLATRTANNWLPSLIDEMFNNDYLGGTEPANRSFLPAVNVSEKDDSFTLEMSIPGFKKEEVSIEVDHDLLTISSEVEKTNEETTEQFTRKEFSKQSFKRSFNLPETVNQDKINAAYDNGILTISLPKKEEALPQPKRMISLK
ncbi:HSP20 family protein [Nonlabens dokdonensis]|jgi:HSP20 family protein|uniref:Heat shock related protein HSP20 n=2 Tax=Nonlabens dokdonensis TaxID=328515 RepID=L7W9J3_NONDD|nr:Hsp20/alpha crystallin family protein [Nonlabens dokdonensis]AGC78350.1 heat shock related protein HSP20 [Nonlabens dokdonensis DSW-6]PZX38102.1 HSP20 family protein [Nonlabens dokdonensis]